MEKLWTIRHKRTGAHFAGLTAPTPDIGDCPVVPRWVNVNEATVLGDHEEAARLVRYLNTLGIVNIEIVPL